jgi:predicted anti-sigma-YlaC factor YlaD
MNCESIHPLLSGFLDGELTDHEFELVHHHVLECQTCLNTVEEMKEIRKQMQDAFFSISAPERLEHIIFNQLQGLHQVEQMNRLSKGIQYGAVIMSLWIVAILISPVGTVIWSMFHIVSHINHIVCVMLFHLIKAQGWLVGFILFGVVFSTGSILLMNRVIRKTFAISS